MERFALWLREWWFVWVILLVFASVGITAYKHHTTTTTATVPESDLLPGKPLVIESGVYVIHMEADNLGSTRIKVGRR